MTATDQGRQASPAAVPAAAFATLVLGALLVDYTRAWLLVIPVLFFIAAFTAGTLLQRLAGRSPAMGQPSTPQVAIRIGTGIAVLSLLATVSAMEGLFRIAGLVPLLLVVAGIVMAVQAFEAGWPSCPLPTALSGVALGAVWLTAWLWGTIPSTFYDELAYHLVIAERAAATGSLLETPWVLFTLTPHASDLLLGWGFMIAGDAGAHALHWSLFAWVSLAAWGLMDAMLLPRSSYWTAALVSGALASSPTFWFLGTLTFAETCLTAALMTVASILVTAEPQDRPWLPAGLLLGLAATVKLSGPAWILAGLAAAWVLRWPARHVSFAALIAVASVIPWWGRAAWFTGNPIYPMAYRWLGGGGLWDDANQALLNGDLPPGASELGIVGLLRLPWDLVQHPERFGSASDVGALAVVGTVMVLLLPPLMRVLKAAPRLMRLGDAAWVFVFLSGCAWAATTTTARFFAPALLLGLVTLLSLLLSYRKAGLALALAMVIPLGAWGTIRFLQEHEAVFSSGGVALGREERDPYLERRLDHYQAASFVRAHVPSQARLLFIGEARPYYFSREALAPYPFDRHPLEQWVREADSPKALADRLVRENITHVVLNINEFSRLHDKYGVLRFAGGQAQVYTDRLKRLPQALRQVYTNNHIYVFEVPSPK